MPGSIPAGAGKPISESSCLHTRWVYPRGCGEAMTSSTSPPPATGLSPRVRGSRHVDSSSYCYLRSIPAGAGKPGPRGARSPARAVYPRGCGEACTGGRPQKTTMVYPRGCGEASHQARRLSLALGLSPRVRGSLARGPDRLAGWGSIPAGAGKPHRASVMKSTGAGLSPRVRGSPCESRSDQSFPSTGLSPRVRGSLSEN